MLAGNEIDGIAEAQACCCHERPAGFDAASRLLAPFGQDDGIDALESPRRLAQRARGQQLAIAESPHRIDHGDLEITRQPQMLQAVIADDDLGARLGRTPSGGDAIGADHDHARSAQRVQHGLVTAVGTGTAVITAETDQTVGQAQVIVTEIPIGSCSLSPT